MITGFENETTTLTVTELLVVPHVVRMFEDNTSPLTNDDIAKRIKEIETQLPKMNGSRIRKIINYVRRRKLVVNLIANSKGYYVAKDENEVKNYIQSLDERINAIIEIKKSFQ